MNINLNKLSVVIGEKKEDSHKNAVFMIFNENIEYSHLTKEPINYEEHSKWWDNIFDDEWIYLIKLESEYIGYIRLTKKRTLLKDKHEISIALRKKYQKLGIGPYAYDLFERKIKKQGVLEIIARTENNNLAGQKFFEKINFKKVQVKYKKELID